MPSENKRKRLGSSKMKYRKRTKAKASPAVRAAIRRTVNRMSETKQNWLSINESSLTTTHGAVFYDPMQVNRGNDRDDRQGIQISPTGIHLKGFLHNNGGETDFVRIIIFRAKVQTNFGTAIECFDNADGNPVDPSVINDGRLMYYPLSKNKMTVLWDRVFKVGPKTTATNGQHVQFFNQWIPLRGKVRFDGLNDGNDNAYPRYHIAFFHTEADQENIGETMEVSFLSRFFYKDM